MLAFRLLAFVAAAVVACCASLSVTGSSSAGVVPILAGPWAPSQEGYGHIRPATIFNGGDPTGLTDHIHWKTWGHVRAIGTGTGLWVGPTQAVYQGTRESGFRVVLFHLGRCRGRRAYNAISVYSPRHGQHFNAGQYVNACDGSYHGFS